MFGWVQPIMLQQGRAHKRQKSHHDGNRISGQTEQDGMVAGRTLA